MAILGTKKIWKPAPHTAASQKENQILKNAGYINIQLYCVNYMAKGNFWQDVFGGKDHVVLTTSLKYQTGVETIEATSVQDMREVRVNQNYNLGLQRNLAVKVPAHADAIALEVKMTAVKNDVLQAKFDMLNQPDFQSALQLAPAVVGQVLTITSLVKKLFSDTAPQAALEASYAGIVGLKPEDHPVSNGKLTQGMLILLSTNEGDAFNKVDESKFELRGDTLYYNNRQVENTYIVFNITFEPLKGDDEKANWFRKYSDALNNLDKIHTTEDEGEIIKIFNDSKTLWIEGNALLDADETYINKEKMGLKGVAIKAIKEKYNELHPATAPPPAANLMPATETLKNLTANTPFNVVKAALPVTGKFLKAHLNPDVKSAMDGVVFTGLSEHEEELGRLLARDANDYLSHLEASAIDLKLNARA